MHDLPRTVPPRPRSISVSSDTDSPVAGRLALPDVPPSPTASSVSLPQSPIGTHETLDYPSPEINWPHMMYGYEPYLSPHLPRRYSSDRHSRIHGVNPSGEEKKEREAHPERNRIDIGKIERGEETRTTVSVFVICFSAY